MREGENEILVRVTNPFPQPCLSGFALRMEPEIGPLSVLLPVSFDAELQPRWSRIESLVQSAWTDKYVYGSLEGDKLHRNEPVRVCYPETDVAEEITHRLMSPQGDIFQEWSKMGGRGLEFCMAVDFPIQSGERRLSFSPPAEDFYIKGLRISRQDLIHILRTKYHRRPNLTYSARKKEALSYILAKHAGDPWVELVKLDRKQFDNLSLGALSASCESVRLDGRGGLRDALALALILRHRQKKRLGSSILQRIRETLTETIEANRMPGKDWAEFEQFLAQALVLLFDTGESVTGTTEALMKWMAEKAFYGFREWNSAAAMEAYVSGLTLLSEHSDREDLRDLSIAVLDKVLFDLASQQWNGMVGGPAGWVDDGSALSARLEPTSGIIRMLWGMGNYNESLMGLSCLCLSKTYRPADVLEEIGQSRRNALWQMQRAADGAEWTSYQTNDFKLSCVNGYKIGQPGNREHIWQACLGPDAIVYTNHPANARLHASGAGFWAGNRVLPAAYQWGDAVACLYNLPKDDWMGFTHAYFPSARMDEFALDERMAFARVGDAYLALRASAKLEWITSGPSAYRELRCHSPRQAWVCQMGHALLDGSFQEFIRKFRMLPMRMNGSSIKLTTLRGDDLSLRWSGEFLVNGQSPQPDARKQYLTPWCESDFGADELTIISGEKGMRIRFS